MQQATIAPTPVVAPAETDQVQVMHRPARRRRSLASWAGTVILLAAIASPIILQRYLTFDPALVISFGYIAVIILGALGSLTFFLPVPTMTLVFAGATMLNPFLLAVAAAAGITIGMAGCYALGRAGSGLAERSQPDPGTRLYRVTVRVNRWYGGNVTVASFFIAAVPNPVFDYIGYFSGLTGASQSRFLFGTFVGKTVQSLIIALLGYYAFEQISRVW